MELIRRIWIIKPALHLVTGGAKPREGSPLTNVLYPNHLQLLHGLPVVVHMAVQLA